MGGSGFAVVFVSRLSGAVYSGFALFAQGSP